jgi:surfeit locus 1 family protein
LLEGPLIQEGEPMPRRFPIWLTFWTVLGVALLVTLGCWQWERLGEKEALLDGMRRQLDATAVPLGASPAPFTRVKASGVYLADKAVPVRATLPAPEPDRSLGGLGFWWLVPLQLDDGRVVLVNRGFVPARPDTKPPAIATPAGRQTVEGIVRAPDHGNYFLPTDDPAHHEFFRRDPAILAGPLGLALAPTGPLASFTIDALRAGDRLTAPVGLDIADFIAQVPNKHLSYAFTWWGLALTLIGVYLAFLLSSRRRDSVKGEPG